MSVPVPYFEDFEGGAPGWTTLAFTHLCQWQLMTNPETIAVHPSIYGEMVELGDPRPAYLPSAYSGNTCWWYGSPESGTFIGNPFDDSPFPTPVHTGGSSYEAHGGSLTSPVFETSDLGHIMFSFWTWWEVECIDIDQFDMMFILVSKNYGVSWDTLNWLNPPFARLPGWEHWQSYSSGGYLAPAVWIRWNYFLDSEYSGHDIMIRFLFDTQDALYNGFRGWFIDDVYVAGGLQEAQLLRRAEYPNPLEIVDCRAEPNPFPLDFIIENVGGEAAEEVMLTLELPPELGISFGLPTTPLGTMPPGRVDTAHWQIEILEQPLFDTTICWGVIVTSADSLIGYRDDFEGDTSLFTGDFLFDYCDVRLAEGPDSAISGFGVAGIPSDGSEQYPPGVLSTLTSLEFDLTGWTEAFISFWYWLSVPRIDPFGWSRDGEDGFLVEYQVDGGPWRQLDEYGVGLLLPRYDAYIDGWTDNPLANRMAYCDSTGRWVEVVSQDLIGMGIFPEDSRVRVRFVFGSTSSNHRQGLFIDEFRLSTVQYPIGPYLHTFCIDVPGTRIPSAILVMPLDGTSTSCERQEIVVNAAGESYVDPSRVVIWANGETRFSLDDGNLSFNAEMGRIAAQFPIGEAWSEGWHTVRMDTCYNILGCNLEEPLVFEFLADFSPPVATLIDPPDGIFHMDVAQAVTISIEDTLTGVDNASIGVIFCGEYYGATHPAVEWNGSELVFHPELIDSGRTWLDCSEICVIAGDSPHYCPPNVDTTCFEITIVLTPPTATLITPAIDAVSSCDDQGIVIAIEDSMGVSEEGAVLIVDGVRYVSGVDPELILTNDTLFFTPPTFWEHEQIVEGALVQYYSIYHTPNVDTVEFSFIVDLRPPNVLPISPLAGELTPDGHQVVEFQIEDFPAGLDLSTFQVICDGNVVNFDDGEWTPSGDGGSFRIRPLDIGFSFRHGDTISIQVHICDMPDFCAANCTTAVWHFFIEPETSCMAKPNPFTPNDDGINDFVFFDYPRSYIRPAEMKIFSLDNIEVFSDEIQGVSSWDGIDNFGRPLRNGLYIYMIISDGRVVCNGTVLLLR